jgi:predicted nucleic-acid-binding Zn-ribbon protein
MIQSTLFDIQSNVQTVKAWCKCGMECDCVIRTFSNGTKHAWGTCPRCGLTNAKQQRRYGTLLDIENDLQAIRRKILAISKGVDQDEAVCMLERQAEDLWKEIDQ